MQLPTYKLSTTHDQLTGRSGLICLAELMSVMNFADVVDRHFPKSGSNRGFSASLFVMAVMLMLHDGANCLDDLNAVREDKGLCKLMGLDHVPTSGALGDWLRRLGLAGVSAITEVNRFVLKRSLGTCRFVTLDIDATLSASSHQEALWTYKKCKGYMPMVGHIAETGQIVATEFRAGNVAPATDNRGFIKRCEAALPVGVSLGALRIDAAGYQVDIVDDCMDRSLDFAIRAKMSASLKQLIMEQPETSWQPLIDRNGQPSRDETTMRLVHTMAKSRYAFSVVVQRRAITGQQPMDLESSADDQEIIEHGGYLYRAIATNLESMSDSEIIHWYNQRAEHSENRIKELKGDFGAMRMPCKAFEASAFYLALCALAYNLFALLRQLLPLKLQQARAKQVRHRLYAIAGKVVYHGRQLYLKLCEQHRLMLETILLAVRQWAQAP